MIKQLIQTFRTKKIETNIKLQTMKEGTVKFFNNAKGFGFITIKDTNEEIFVHSTNLMEDIREDDNVQFEVEKGEKGLSAIKVSLI
ncbi:Cold shock-like protein [Constantimarinum furrinae]|uniref:Cold shock-like protein n=2 Tax=Constantimarinum furrinae TaxID=2562285 RepID=A0A7G8PWP5_9FLAO|nr:Cold shock-like protein [Constantimarinum furrinae]